MAERDTDFLDFLVELQAHHPINRIELMHQLAGSKLSAETSTNAPMIMIPKDIHTAVMRLLEFYKKNENRRGVTSSIIKNLKGQKEKAINAFNKYLKKSGFNKNVQEYLTRICNQAEPGIVIVYFANVSPITIPIALPPNADEAMAAQILLSELQGKITDPTLVTQVVFSSAISL